MPSSIVCLFGRWWWNFPHLPSGFSSYPMSWLGQQPCPLLWSICPSPSPPPLLSHACIVPPSSMPPNICPNPTSPTQWLWDYVILTFLLDIWHFQEQTLLLPDIQTISPTLLLDLLIPMCACDLPCFAFQTQARFSPKFCFILFCMVAFFSPTLSPPSFVAFPYLWLPPLLPTLPCSHLFPGSVYTPYAVSTCARFLPSLRLLSTSSTCLGWLEPTLSPTLVWFGFGCWFLFGAYTQCCLCVTFVLCVHLYFS